MSSHQPNDPTQPRNGNGGQAPLRPVPSQRVPLQLARKSTSHPPPPRRIVDEDISTNTNTDNDFNPRRLPPRRLLVVGVRPVENDQQGDLADYSEDESVSETDDSDSEEESNSEADSDTSSSAAHDDNGQGPDFDPMRRNGIRRGFQPYAVKSTSLPPPPRRIVNDTSNVVVPFMHRPRLTTELVPTRAVAAARRPTIPLTVKATSSPTTRHSTVTTFVSGLPGFVEGIPLRNGNELGKRKSSPESGQSDTENLDSSIKQVKLGVESQDEKDQGQ